MILRTLLAGLALTGALGLASAAQAATLALGGNQTTVEVTADLAGLGLSGAPFGTATVDATGANPVFAFAITGGTLDTVTGNALIAHEGSGVTLAALADPAVSATVGNFLIDTAGATVFGDVIGGAADIALFTFGTVDDAGVELLIAGDLAGALTAVFGAADLTGARFGIAVPDVAPVPLPGALPLLASALIAAGLVRGRTRRAA